MTIEDRSVTALNEAVTVAAGCLPRWVPRRTRLAWSRRIVGCLWAKWLRDPPESESDASEGHVTFVPPRRGTPITPFTDSD